MPITVSIIGRELCFYCLEEFRKCPIHDNSNVFWNDVSVRNYSGESDGFRIVNERDLINVTNSVQYTENGKFFLPSTGSSFPISQSFQFEASPETSENSSISEIRSEPEKINQTITPNVSEIFKVPKLPKREKKEKKEKKERKQREVKYSKIHENAVKTIAKEYTKGKKCDASQKIFVCDICEISFTLRHNLQWHLVQFHGDSENVTEEKVAVLKEMLTKK